MSEYIAFDSHKRYTGVEREEVESGRMLHHRLAHQPGAIRSYLAGCPGDAAPVRNSTPTSRPGRAVRCA
jgi:hypothetical protein